MDKKKLIDKAMEYEKIMAEKRGYGSGITATMLNIFSIDQLKELNKKTEKTLKQLGWIVKED